MRPTDARRPGRGSRVGLGGAAPPVLALGVLGYLGWAHWKGPGPAGGETPDAIASRDAFLAAYPVFMHPRCQNCHPVGDVPLVGEDSHPHLQNVQRGPDGKGKYALK